MDIEINNADFVESMMILTEQSHRDRQHLEKLLAAPFLTANARKVFEGINRTLVTYEEVVRELSEQLMQIEEALTDDSENSQGDDREENPPPNET